MVTAVLLVVMVCCTVAANVLMKLGASAIPSPILLGWLSWKSATGIATFGCAGIIYAQLLKYLPLNVATSFAAVQFVSVILASAVVLAERIPGLRWIGIALIVAGIVVVGVTLDATHASAKFRAEVITLLDDDATQIKGMPRHPQE